MTSRSDDPDNKDNKIQPSLFEAPADCDAPEPSPAPRFPELDDAAAASIFVSLMALDSLKGVGSRTLRTLFDAGLLAGFFSMDASELTQRISATPGSGKSPLGVARAVVSDRQSLLEKGQKAVEELRRQQVSFVPIGHATYPKCYYRMPDPPRWVFVKGNLEVIQSPSVIAVVGTRKATPAGLKLAYGISVRLTERNVVVLSGLAKGIDERAHTGATDYFGQSIAVLGHGMHAPEATTNQPLWHSILEMDGAIISEYMPTDPPSSPSFLRRNELQVAMSRAVIPVECPSMESGTGATIRRALNLGTPVLGVSLGNGDEAELATTRANLAGLGIPVFRVSTESSVVFWSHLREIMPEHKWEPDPTPRQERLFRTVERLVLPAKKRMAIDDAVIDRLAEHLKRKLDQQAP